MTDPRGVAEQNNIITQRTSPLSDQSTDPIGILELWNHHAICSIVPTIYCRQICGP